MGFDVVLIAIIVGGIALSVAYVRAEYLSWRKHGAARRRRDALLRELHAVSLSEQRDALLPSVMKLQGFGESEAANNSSRPFAPAERRKRARQRAAP
jgi:hypothetical protein